MQTHIEWRLRAGLDKDTSISVAVLPFENVGAQPELEYLSDGITEVLISSLSRKPGLKVMARSTVFHYKGRIGDAVSIGKQLGVSSVVTGRVLQRGNIDSNWSGTGRCRRWLAAMGRTV